MNKYDLSKINGDVTVPNNIASGIEENRAAMEVQGALIIAKKYPRDPIAAFDNIKQACGRKSLAERAMYNYTVGNELISGPSIRLAEAIAQLWGNIEFGIKELSVESGKSSVYVYAWDLETNVKISKHINVDHVRYTKSGVYPLKDPKQIYELVAANASKRLRTCILSIIPSDIIEEAVEECERTLKRTVDLSPEKIKQMIEQFDLIGVNRAMLEKRIKRRVDSITSSQMIQLRKIYASIKDEMSGVADWFDISDDKPSNKEVVIKAIKNKKDEATEDLKDEIPEQSPEVRAKMEDLFGKDFDKETKQ